MNNPQRIWLLILLVLLSGYMVYLFFRTNDSIDDLKESVNDLEITVQIALEQAYFDGQVDALTGDIRIKQLDSIYWRATKSFWDDGKLNHKDIFTPSTDVAPYVLTIKK